MSALSDALTSMPTSESHSFWAKSTHSRRSEMVARRARRAGGNIFKYAVYDTTMYETLKIVHMSQTLACKPMASSLRRTYVVRQLVYQTMNTNVSVDVLFRFYRSALTQYSRNRLSRLVIMRIRLLCATYTTLSVWRAPFNIRILSILYDVNSVGNAGCVKRLANRCERISHILVNDFIRFPVWAVVDGSTALQWLQAAVHRMWLPKPVNSCTNQLKRNIRNGENLPTANADAHFGKETKKFLMDVSALTARINANRRWMWMVSFQRQS